MQTAGRQISQACAGFWACMKPADSIGFVVVLLRFSELVFFSVLAMGGFGLDYLPATSSSSESSWHQSSTPSGTWASQGPPAVEDSSAVLMESLKVCLTETVLRNGCLSVGPEDPVMGISLLQAPEFSFRN